MSNANKPLEKKSTIRPKTSTAQKSAEASPIHATNEDALLRAVHSPEMLDSADANALQRTIGNQALRRLLQRKSVSEHAQPQVDPKPSLDAIVNRIHTLGVQPKLTVGAVDDPQEKEADQMAAQVVRKIHSSVQRQEDDEALDMQREDVANRQEEDELALQRVDRVQRQEEDELEMKRVDAVKRQEEDELDMKRIQRVVTPTADPMLQGGAIDGKLEATIRSAKGGGQPLADTLRKPMESAFNADFRNVRVHTDGQSDELSRAIQAQAFTSGQDVFFRKSAFEPGSQGGQELIAHELAHVIQQQGSPVKRKRSTAASLVQARRVAEAAETIHRAVEEVQAEGGTKFISTRDRDKTFDTREGAAKHDAILKRMGAEEQVEGQEDAEPEQAEAALLPEQLKALQPGDVLVQLGGNFFAKAGQFMTGKRNFRSGHSAIATGNLSIVEATNDGVEEKGLPCADGDDRIATRYVVYRSTDQQLSKAAGEQAQTWAGADVMEYGTGKAVFKTLRRRGLDPDRALKLGAYAKLGVMPAKVFCSEFVVSCYHGAAYKALVDNELLAEFQRKQKDGELELPENARGKKSRIAANNKMRSMIKSVVKSTKQKPKVSQKVGGLNVNSQHTSPAGLFTYLQNEAAKDQPNWTRQGIFYQKDLTVK
jgi:hypothetical protein